ncbi:nucleotidyltransferase [Streptomyces sp. So13.3]|uniref:nucleotidyltransferase domain-containing protein n=1 Tax=Streptomyces sp. So13.3 TaxID=2136173 RepID=UPI001FD03FB8|nr:nucleotidyltransferase [Streptomyces sp. So13.3]
MNAFHQTRDNTDSLEQMLSMLLDGAVEVLDISPDLHDTAVRRYKEVGAWLAENGSPGWEIHSQGSFLLGTVVRPGTESGEYDIDLVCRLPLKQESTSKEGLKQRVGDQLVAYRGWKQRQGHTDGPDSLEARRRCWTLGYPGFHLDVLPAIPDEDHPPTGILLTDKNLHKWQHSNPLGYADWFRKRSEQSRALLEKLHANVAEVPEHHIRSTLQRLVQILKWHCMLFFAEDTDNRPPSILLTTLAGRAYRGEDDLFTAVRNVLAAMARLIENREGQWWVPNPAHEEENFTDKWNEYPERRRKFLSWFDEISTTMDGLSLMESKGLDVVYSRLVKSFEAGPMMRSYERYAAREKASTVQRMSPTGLLSATAVGPRRKPNTFYGQHPGPRG